MARTPSRYSVSTCARTTNGDPSGLFYSAPPILVLSNLRIVDLETVMHAEYLGGPIQFLTYGRSKLVRSCSLAMHHKRSAWRQRKMRQPVQQSTTIGVRRKASYRIDARLNWPFVAVYTHGLVAVHDSAPKGTCHLEAGNDNRTSRMRKAGPQMTLDSAGIAHANSRKYQRAMLYFQKPSRLNVVVNPE